MGWLIGVIYCMKRIGRSRIEGYRKRVREIANSRIEGYRKRVREIANSGCRGFNRLQKQYTGDGRKDLVADPSSSLKPEERITCS